jgi:hygromycin-B 7''-O-kinase
MPFPLAADESGWNALLRDDAALAAGVSAVCARHGLDGRPVVRYDGGSLPVYALGTAHVLKLFPPHEGAYAAIEARALAAVQDALPIPTPRLLAADTVGGWHCLLMSQLRGRRLLDVWPELSTAERDRFADEFGNAVATLHAIDTAAVADFAPRWDEFLSAQRKSVLQRQQARRLDPCWLERLPGFLEAWMPALDAGRSLLHTELMREHLLVVRDAERWCLSGLCDFEPAMLGAPEYDFASFGLFVACGDGRFLRRTLLAYGYRHDQLDAALQCRLMAYAMLHRYSNLSWYLERLPARGATTFEELAVRWWPLVDGASHG